MAQKVFTSAVIATQSGELKLPAVRVPWWNSNTNELSYAELPERTLTVTANPNQTPQTASTSNEPAASTPLVESTMPTGLEPSNPWQWNYLSMLLLVLWLLTVLVIIVGWLKSRQPASNVTTNNPLASQVKFNAKKFKSACLENDQGLATQLLLRWASQHLDADIQQLPQLIKVLPESALKIETEKLAYHAYQALQTPWHGTSLFEAWAKFKHLQQMESPELLKPFYPK